MQKTLELLIVKKIIDGLPELQKCIIRLRDIEGYELLEIAEIMGTQVSAVSMNLSRARKKVREQLFRVMNYKL
jgi:RNA polymerase sigma-70 factor (ECF subfamily)